MAMIRQRRALAQAVPTALLLSARTAEDVLFSEELHCIEISDPAFVLALAITREKPVRASDFARRIDGMMVQEILTRLQESRRKCSSAGLTDSSTSQPIARCWRAWTPPSSRRSATGLAARAISRRADRRRAPWEALAINVNRFAEHSLRTPGL